MSSLAASRADNFYFPPEWRPEMGSISKFQGSKGANQYEQYGIIRFELPFDAWCLGCSRHMSKGLRFNAKKDKAGKYFTTQIWSFSMKCYSCDQRFKILTDPENSTYNFAEGLRKHEQDFEPDVNDSIINPVTDEMRRQISSDPMFRLQHENEDILKIQTEKQRFESLADIKESLYKKDYDMNSALRKGNRARKKAEKIALNEGVRRGLAIPLLQTSEEDRSMASLVSFKKGNQFKISERQKITKLQSESLFALKDGEEGRLKGEKRKQQVEVAMMKQARVKLNPSHFKLSTSTSTSVPGAAIGILAQPVPSIPVVRRKVDIDKQSTHTDSTSDGQDEPPPFRNALSMLADY